MSAIMLENLTKAYATGVTAVDGLTLDVADGGSSCSSARPAAARRQRCAWSPA